METDLPRTLVVMALPAESDGAFESAGIRVSYCGVGKVNAAITLTRELRRYVHAGEALPLGDGSIDMVFMSMVFHHFEDQLQAARECRRVLRAGGTVCIRAATVDRIATYPYVPFFARSRSIQEATIQSQSRIEAIFRDAGFELARHELVRHEVASNWRIYADKIAAGADSILAQLSEDEFREGIHLLRQHAASAGNALVIEVVDLFAFRRT